MTESAPGWWATPLRKSAVDAFNAESDPAKRVALWANVQKAIYEEVPASRSATSTPCGARDEARRRQPAAWPYFWNVSLKQ